MQEVSEMMQQLRFVHQVLCTSHRQMVASSQQLTMVLPSADTAVCRTYATHHILAHVARNAFKCCVCCLAPAVLHAGPALLSHHFTA